MEKWKQFAETDKKQYYVSPQAQIKSIDKTTGEKQFLKVATSTRGRKVFTIPNGKQYYVYRLVADAFIPNPENKPTVNHINGLDAGDGIENLEWATWDEQHEHAIRTGLRTGGNTPYIALNSNGEVIEQYDTKIKALRSYDGKKIYYNKDTQIVGNVILMKQSYFDELTEDEVFAIVTECFDKMLEYGYAVDNQLISTSREASKIVDCHYSNIVLMTKNKAVANIKGHEVSRLKNLLGVGSNE